MAEAAPDQRGSPWAGLGWGRGWCRPSPRLLDAVPVEAYDAVVVQAFLADRSREFRARVFLAYGASGQVAGMVAVGRICFDRWLAAPWLFDEEAAPALARAIDASPAAGVVGPERVLRPLAPHLRRGRLARHSPFFPIRDLELHEFASRRHNDLRPVEGPRGLRLPPLDPRVREATADDVAPIMDIMGETGYDYVPTRARARRYVRQLVARHRVLVAEVGTRTVGMIWIEFRSPRWDMWSGLRVHPSALRSGLSWALVFEAIRRSEMEGRTFCCMVADTNTMIRQSYLRSHPEVRNWYTFVLRPRTVFRGQRRVRGLVEWMEGRRENALPG